MIRNFRAGPLNFSPDLQYGRYEKRWQDRVMPGHITLGPVTVSGANAMHWAIDIQTPWGYLCAHPTTRTFGGYWPWYVYLSRNATPQGRSWGIGPGLRWQPKEADA